MHEVVKMRGGWPVMLIRLMRFRAVVRRPTDLGLGLRLSRLATFLLSSGKYGAARNGTGNERCVMRVGMWGQVVLV